MHLKKDCNVGYSNIDESLVHTISVLDLECMVCEMIVEDKNERPKRLKLYPDQYDIYPPLTWYTQGEGTQTAPDTKI